MPSGNKVAGKKTAKQWHTGCVDQIWTLYREFCKSKPRIEETADHCLGPRGGRNDFYKTSVITDLKQQSSVMHLSVNSTKERGSKPVSVCAHSRTTTSQLQLTEQQSENVELEYSDDANNEERASLATVKR